MKKILTYIIPVLAGFLVGFLTQQLQAQALHDWYPYLIKPSLTPPNAAFPIAWGLIYLMSGISLGIILNSNTIRRREMITLWCTQLILNATWSALFFYMRNPLLGAINIIILDVIVVIYIIKAFRIDKVSSILYWPYAAWLAFATYLNIFIMLNN